MSERQRKTREGRSKRINVRMILLNEKRDIKINSSYHSTSHSSTGPYFRTSKLIYLHLHVQLDFAIQNETLMLLNGNSATTQISLV